MIDESITIMDYNTNEVCLNNNMSQMCVSLQLHFQNNTL